MEQHHQYLEDSSIAASSITVGGGQGGAISVSGTAGGSGGGMGGNNTGGLTGGAGTAGEGFDGGTTNLGGYSEVLVVVEELHKLVETVDLEILLVV